MRWDVCLVAMAVISASWTEAADACQKCRRSRCCCVQMVPACRPGASAAANGAKAAAGQPGGGLADDINVAGAPAAAAGPAAGSLGDDINLNLGVGAASTTLPAWAEENWKELATYQSKKVAKAKQILDLSRENVSSGNPLTPVAKTAALDKKIKDSWGIK